MTRTKESVAVVVRGGDGRILVVRRPDDPADPLAGLWGLPAVTRRAGETERVAAERIGPLKLGVTLAVGARLGAQTADRGGYVIRLAEYEASVISGIPVVPQADDSVTQYVECAFTGEPAVLLPAAERGSLCARIFLDAAGIGWR